MKSLSEKMRSRRKLDRAKTTVEIRLPLDVVEDLREMAPVLGMSSYQALIRAYISQGMREDESRLERPEVRLLIQSLEASGASPEAISEKLGDTFRKIA